MSIVKLECNYSRPTHEITFVLVVIFIAQAGGHLGNPKGFGKITKTHVAAIQKDKAKRFVGDDSQRAA